MNKYYRLSNLNFPNTLSSSYEYGKRGSHGDENFDCGVTGCNYERLFYPKAGDSVFLRKFVITVNTAECHSTVQYSRRILIPSVSLA
jgi:hypothetical protein